jgi:hypothetical protein
VNNERLEKEARLRYKRDFLRVWYKQHYNLSHNDPLYTEATDYGISQDFHEWVAWKQGQQEAEEAEFQKLVTDGLACEHCHTRFSETPLGGTCPVCKTTMRVAIDAEVQSYLDEAGLTPEEF